MALYVVVTTDAFRMGGRETFLRTHLEEMINRENCECALLAPVISESAPRHLLNCSDEVDGAGLAEIRSWIKKGSALLNGTCNTLIWSHHYRMLPAWLLSALFNRPMIPTFHGPLINRNLVGPKLDALGLALVFHRLPLISAVSQEISESIRKIAHASLNVRLFPNRVREVERIDRPGQHRTRMLLLTRYEKLQHIRSAVELAGRWRRLIGPVELLVCSNARQVSNNIEASVRRHFLLASEILGRRWVAQGLDRVIGALLTRFEPPTEKPEEKAAQSDIVLGMGRALLEGLAAGRPSILVGYEHVIGLVTNDNFASFRFSNFSGRNAPAQSLSHVIYQTANAHFNGQSLAPEILEDVSISRGWKHFWTTVVEATSVNMPTEKDHILAKKIFRLSDTCMNEDAFIKAAVSCLQPNEQDTFRRLVSLGS